MKKNQVRGIIILAVVLVAFLVLALLIPFSHTATYWVGFIFGIVGIIVAAIGFLIAFGKDDSAKSRFYGFPIARLALIYVIVQVIVSFVLMGIAALIPSWPGIIICVILLVLVIIGLIATDVTRDEIEQMDVKLKKDVSSMRTLQSRASMLVNSTENETVKGEVKKLAEEFRFSDPVSNDATVETEAQISELMTELETAVTDGDEACATELVKKVSGLLKERNRLCKLNK